MELSPHFAVGEYKMILDSSNFTSYIMLHQDTSQTWALFMILSGGSQTEGMNQAMLTNGSREISLMTVTSNRYGNDPRSLPATGYEFVEGDQAIGALSITAEDYGVPINTLSGCIRILMQICSFCSRRR